MTNTSNPIEFLLNLGINTPQSQTNIKNAITQIQKNLDQQLDVTLSVKSTGTDNKVFTEMQKQINTLKKEIDTLNKELSKVGSAKNTSGGSNNPFKPLVDGGKDAIKTLDELKKKSIEGNGTLQFKYDKDNLTNYKSAILSVKNELGELQKVTYKALYSDKGELVGFKALETMTKNTDFEKFNLNQSKATQRLKELEHQGNLSTKQIRHFRDALNGVKDNDSLDKVVKQLEAANTKASRKIQLSSIQQINKDAEILIQTLKNLGKSSGLNTTTDEFKKLMNSAKDLSTAKVFNTQGLKEAQSEIRKLSQDVTKLSTSTKGFDSVNNQINKLIVSLGRTGTLDSSKLNRYSAELQQIASSSDSVSGKVKSLNSVMTRLTEATDAAAHKNSMKKSMQDARKEIDNLISSLTRVENQWKKSVNKNDVTRLRTELNGLTVPNFNTQSQVDAFKANLGGVRERIRLVNAEATKAARSSMGVIEAFQTAMTRFPVWMASSTIFYGAIRGVKDLTDKVIELDTHMTALRRVMDMPDHKFNDMLEQTMMNVDTLSGKMQEYMKFVEEFGRMGFDDVETLDMSNTAQVLNNISDLDAGDTVNALVAAMLSFNVAAEDSITIADKLNEVKLLAS